MYGFNKYSALLFLCEHMLHYLRNSNSVRVAHVFSRLYGTIVHYSFITEAESGFFNDPS